MICRDVVELMTDYLEGALSPADVERFDAHIAGCDGCRAYLEQMKATMKLTGRLGSAEPIPEPLEAELTRAFRHWRSEKDRPV